MQGEALSLTARQALYRMCPVLHAFLKHHLTAGPVPAPLIQLLTAIIQVQLSTIDSPVVQLSAML